MTLPARRDYERRRAARHACPEAPPVQLLPEAGFQPLQGRVRDISKDGIGLICSESFPVGTVLALRWAADDRKTLVANVVHAATQADGTTLVGCRFVNALTQQEVETLTGPATAEGIRRAVLHSGE